MLFFFNIYLFIKYVSVCACKHTGVMARVWRNTHKFEE